MHSAQKWYIQGELCGLTKKETRRERLKSALFLRLKKRKTFFLEKNLKFLNIFLSKNDPLGFINIHSVAKFKKLEGGTLWGHKNVSQKRSSVPKKIQRWDPLGTSGFVGFLERVKNDRGNLWIKFALVGLGLRWFQGCF